MENNTKAVNETKANMVNLKELFVAGLGYSEKVWKGQKTRASKLALGIEAENVVSVEDAKEILKSIAGGKGKYKGIALDLYNKDLTEFDVPFKEEEKTASKGKESLKSDLKKALLLIKSKAEAVDSDLSTDVIAIIDGLTL